MIIPILNAVSASFHQISCIFSNFALGTRYCTISAMNTGVLPNQYMTNQNMAQIPQQYPFQQVGEANRVDDIDEYYELFHGINFTVGSILAEYPL